MNEENLQQYIDAILANLDAQRAHGIPHDCTKHSYNTVAKRHEQHAHRAGQQRFSTTDERETLSDQHSQTVIDVYVIERDAAATEAEPPTVESTLEPVTQEARQNEEDEEQETPSPVPHEWHRTRLRWWMVALVVVVGLLLIGGGTGLFVLYFFAPSASVTLVTTARQLTTTSTVQVVTNGTADPTKNQVPGRLLPAITMSQQKTVPTTGAAHQDAKAAHGLITFYNAAPYTQTVGAGTLLTGADGIQVITDQDATIPAAVMPTEGQVTILAHTATTGPEGNIRAGDIYGQCCRINVFVANGTFHGGQDARTYQTVTQQDITTVAESVKNSLEQSVQAALQAQVQSIETLVTPLSCTSKVTPDHHVGEEAIQVQVMVDETCTGTTYTTQAVTTLATQRATQDAITRLGTGYTTTGVQTRITQGQKANHGSSELQITSVSMWAYPFTQEQQTSIKAMITGMSKDKATATLLHLTGVQSVSITLKNGTTLPTDAQHISLLFLQV